MTHKYALPSVDVGAHETLDLFVVGGVSVPKHLPAGAPPQMFFVRRVFARILRVSSVWLRVRRLCGPCRCDPRGVLLLGVVRRDSRIEAKMEDEQPEEQPFGRIEQQYHSRRRTKTNMRIYQTMGYEDNAYEDNALKEFT